MNIMREARRNTLQAVPMILIIQLFLLLLQSKTTESVNISLPGCPDRCGEILIPYPFGIGTNCSMSDAFNTTCKTNGSTFFIKRKNDGKSIPYLFGNFVEIVNINVPLGEASFNLPIASRCYNTTTNTDDDFSWGIGLSDSDLTPFWVNNEKNKFIVTGCNTFSYLAIDNFTGYSVGCLSTCDSLDSLNKYGASCSGIGCCQTAIPKVTKTLSVNFDSRYNQSLVHNFSPCSYAMLVENTAAGFKFNSTSITTDELVGQGSPARYDWVIGKTTCDIAQTNRSSYECKSNYSVCLNSRIGHGYICNCSDGYEGNPYLQGGCQDIDECITQNPCSKHSKCHNLPGKYRCSCSFGWRTTHNNTQSPCELNLPPVIGICASFVALSFIGFATYIASERRNISKIKEKYFQEHGGWILWEKIKSNQGFGFIIFSKKQVEQATNNFDNTNIIGHGGHGTVYKGNLMDQMVAIKRCKIVDESKKKEFGKEMLILSQISHKNIVKLLGCCLEVEVPMLVYEFIPNGTLHQYIHHKNPESYLSLSVRLRIAYESAEALAYLHTSASPPIIHGDVKSANILLDKKYTAKVSDFGASMLAPTDDEAQIVTFVQGTLGYLDPEYMQTHKLTNKSDVYSFGVVLVELLTSKPIIDFDEPEEERGLAIRFLSAMRENKMQELLDDDIKDDLELISEVVELAKECLSMRGEDRPTMKDIAEELYRINKLKQHPWEQEYDPEETMILLNEESRHDIEIGFIGCSFNVDKEAVESIAVGR